VSETVFRRYDWCQRRFSKCSILIGNLQPSEIFYRGLHNSPPSGRRRYMKLVKIPSAAEIFSYHLYSPGISCVPYATPPRTPRVLPYISENTSCSSHSLHLLVYRLWKFRSSDLGKHINASYNLQRCALQLLIDQLFYKMAGASGTIRRA